MKKVCVFDPGKPLSVRRGLDHSGGLSFNTQEDALDYAGQVVERGKRRLTGKSVNLAKEYIKGDLNLVIHVRAGPNPEVFDLVLGRVPDVVADLAGPPDERVGYGEAVSNGYSAQRNKDAMRFEVTCSTQGPDRLVPSWVRLETFKERSDCRGHIDELLIQLIMDSSGRIRERETGPLGLVPRTDLDRASVHSVIERITEVPEGVFGDCSHAAGQFRCQPDLVDFLSGISIKIDDAGVWLSCKKRFDPRFEIIDMIPCAAQHLAGALEGGQHAKAAPLWIKEPGA